MWLCLDVAGSGQIIDWPIDFFILTHRFGSLARSSRKWDRGPALVGWPIRQASLEGLRAAYQVNFKKLKKLKKPNHPLPNCPRLQWSGTPLGSRADPNGLGQFDRSIRLNKIKPNPPPYPIARGPNGQETQLLGELGWPKRSGSVRWVDCWFKKN